MKQDDQAAKDEATDLAGGVTDDVKADGQVNDIVKSNGPREPKARLEIQRHDDHAWRSTLRLKESVC